MGTYKYCLRCGAKLTAGAKFCYKCGAAQPAMAAPPEEPESAIDVDAIDEAVRAEEASADTAGAHIIYVSEARVGDAHTGNAQNVTSAQSAPKVSAPERTSKSSASERGNKKNTPGTKVVPIIALAVCASVASAVGWKMLGPQRDNSNASVASAPSVQESSAPAASEIGASAPTVSAMADNAQNAAPESGSFIAQYLSAHDPSTITEMTIDCAGSGSVMVYSTYPAYTDYGASVDLEELAPCTSLRTLTIVNASSITMPAQSALPSLQILTIGNSNVSADLAGVENLSGLQRFAANDTTLSDLTNIAKTNIELLMLSHNQVTDLYPLQDMTSLKTFEERGENIWDFRGLKNASSVEIGEKGAGAFNLATTEKDPASRQVQVLVGVLNIRTSPSSATDNNKTGEYALKNGYYYILDEYWDDTSNTTWYKIGASSGTGYWIASKEGDWTKLCE